MVEITIEKRKNVRYPVTKGAYVELEKKRFFNIGKPKLIRLGEVENISKGGVSVGYTGGAFSAVQAEKISLSVPDIDLQIQNLPFQTVTDKIVKKGTQWRIQEMVRAEVQRSECAAATIP